jgi:hypothetical protein
MWSVAEPANAPWPDAVIEPDDVIYEYDGPLTFTARFGFFHALFHKIGKRGDSHFFLALETSRQIIEALKVGHISVRGALQSEKYWVVDLRDTLEVNRYWTCFDYDLPTKFMPESGVAIYPFLPQTVDSLEQANAYFAISFQGRSLTRQGMPFSLLRDLTNSSYDAARRVLSPSFLVGARSATYDFQVRPAVGSLILALGEPIINERRLKQRTFDNPIPLSGVQKYFDAQRGVFFDEMDELVSEAEKGSIKTSLAQERFALLDNVHSVVPVDDERVSSVEFSNTAGDGFRNIRIGVNAGVAINYAYKNAEDQIVTETGVVEQVNWKMSWFAYHSTRGNQVKCHGTSPEFQDFVNDRRLRKGTEVKVTGKLTRRPRRDDLHATKVPVILERRT